jgi:hypothetical protein
MDIAYTTTTRVPTIDEIKAENQGFFFSSAIRFSILLGHSSTLRPASPRGLVDHGVVAQVRTFAFGGSIRDGPGAWAR